jgi:multidrug resistance efflux pump
VSFDSPEVGTRYAWVALQSLQCMDGYLQAKFRRHQGINATFMRFLTRTMADQTAAGLKGQVEKLEKQVKTLTDKLDALATKKSYHDLDAKVEGVISANSLNSRGSLVDAQPPDASL